MRQATKGTAPGRMRHVGGSIALTATMVLALTLPTTAAAAPGQNKVPALFESSFAHEATGNISRALNDVLQIVRLAPGNYVATLRSAWLYYRKGRYGDAIATYRKARKLAPKAVEPVLGETLPLMAAKRWSDAERAAKLVLKRSPRNYLASSRLAFIYFSQARYGEADAWYTRVLSDYPSDTEMMLGLGWTRLRQGRKAEARRIFNAVLAIRRQNSSARAGVEATAQ